MQIRVKLFAIARQRVGSDSIAVELPPNACAIDLRAALAEQHPALAEVLPHIRFAINSDYATDQTPIPWNAEIACIPPVSGG